jgi:hypothetical protein
MKSFVASHNTSHVSRVTVFANDPVSMREFRSNSESHRSGVLIINADDWGRNAETTDRILECVVLGAVSSASGMVFMEDSERAAAMSRERGIDVGLHLNFTTPFSSSLAPPRLREHHRRVAHFLLRNRFCQIVYHPGLSASFNHVVMAQVEEFRRIYGAEPQRFDGHHHMHLCANVLFDRLVPTGTIIRRNFSFAPGEKSWINRFYRKSLDGRLQRRHRLVDFLFSLAPIQPVSRLQRIIQLAHRAVVEIETHPVNPEEYRFLTSKVFLQLDDLQIAPRFAASAGKCPVSGRTVL